MNPLRGNTGGQAQLIILVIGAAVIVAANGRTVHIVECLWRDDAIRYCAGPGGRAHSGC